LTDEERAEALRTFIQAQAPRFTFDEALEVVRSLHIDAPEDHKTLAKRLRKTLQTGSTMRQRRWRSYVGTSKSQARQCWTATRRFTCVLTLLTAWATSTL
jgi:hypothetical protein